MMNSKIDTSHSVAMYMFWLTGDCYRKPRINPQLVAQQVAQQYNPAPPKTNKKEGGHKEKSEEKKSSSHDNKGGKKTWHP